MAEKENSHVFLLQVDALLDGVKAFKEAAGSTKVLKEELDDIERRLVKLSNNVVGGYPTEQPKVKGAKEAPQKIPQQSAAHLNTSWEKEYESCKTALQTVWNEKRHMLSPESKAALKGNEDFKPFIPKSIGKHAKAFVTGLGQAVGMVEKEKEPAPKKKGPSW